LTGTAWLGIACEHLFDIRKSIPADDQLRLVIQLVEIEKKIESLETIIYRDRVWSIHVFGWTGHLQHGLKQLLGEDRIDRLLPLIYRRYIAYLRLLQIEFALRAWKTQHGAWPESLESLERITLGCSVSGVG